MSGCPPETLDGWQGSARQFLCQLTVGYVSYCARQDGSMQPSPAACSDFLGAVQMSSRAARTTCCGPIKFMQEHFLKRSRKHGQHAIRGNRAVPRWEKRHVGEAS